MPLELSFREQTSTHLFSDEAMEPCPLGRLMAQNSTTRTFRRNAVMAKWGMDLASNFLS